MYTVAAILVIGFLVYAFNQYGWPLMSARSGGIETDAVVSHIEREVRISFGAEFPRQFYYATFLTQDGLKNEARLLNPKKALCVGDKIRVRYAPEKNNLAYLVKTPVK